jgi:hypothetical protein
MAIDYLILQKLALQVCGDEIPPMHVHVAGGGEGAESAEGSGPHRRAESLLVVNSGYLCATLNAETSLKLAATFHLVNPNELYKATSMWNLATIDFGPRAVRSVVFQLIGLGCQPTLLICT